MVSHLVEANRSNHLLENIEIAQDSLKHFHLVERNSLSLEILSKHDKSQGLIWLNQSVFVIASWCAEVSLQSL